MLVSTAHLKSRLIKTPLGVMQAIADNEKLHSLKFTTQATESVVVGDCDPLSRIEQELAAYFDGQLKQFATPVQPLGTPFQLRVWQLLATIPHGQTWSYARLAVAVHNQKAVRAVAQANSKNNLAIIIPCHRVIYKNGTLGGYAGGVLQKEKLLALEAKLH